MTASTKSTCSVAPTSSIQSESATIGFDVTFDPAGETGPFRNKASAWSAGKDSGLGADNVDLVRFSLPPVPRIKLDKAVGPVVANGDGTFRVPFTLTATNIGNERLARLRLVSDDLEYFRCGAVCSTSGHPRSCSAP